MCDPYYECEVYVEEVEEEESMEDDMMMMDDESTSVGPLVMAWGLIPALDIASGIN